jgi:hypothetical protein
MQTWACRQRRLRLVLAALALAVLCGVLCAPSPLRADDVESAPSALLTALQLPDAVRYSLVLVRPTDRALANLQVQVVLPPDAELVDTLQTVGRSVFLGNDAGTLRWAAPGYATGDPADAFSFLLSHVPSGAFSAHAVWEDAAGMPGEQSWTDLEPDVTTASATSATVTLVAGAAPGFVTAGDTGIRLQIIGGSLPGDTTITVERSGADTNPPAAPGSPWWCAGVRITGLPDGITLLVLVPARQALPPDLPVSLFRNDGAGWSAEADAASATTDGQFVRLEYQNGLVTAGIGGIFQPTVINIQNFLPAAFALSITGPFILHNFQNGVWTITVKNVGSKPLSKILITILGDGPIDFHSTSPGPNATGFGCTITQGLGALTFTTAQCNLPSLAAGTQKTITLSGGISFAIANPELILVVADDNVPDAPTVKQGAASIDVQIN